MNWTTLEAHAAWPGEISNREEKQAVAARVAEHVRDGQVLGVGSGSTAYLALVAIAERVRRESLTVTAVPTSIELGLAAAGLGLAVTSLAHARPDWGFDGADEVDGDRSLIKGRGGALLREKLVMASQRETWILVDRSKLVERLGGKFPVPVEVVPEAVHLVEERLGSLGAAEIELRRARSKDGPVVTENGNLLLDARFDGIAPGLEREIAAVPGVVESGLFQGFPVEIVTPD
jgi:ribose 5-phosphate isomerase A